MKAMIKGWLKKQTQRAGYALSALAVGGLAYTGLDLYKYAPTPEPELSVDVDDLPPVPPVHFAQPQTAIETPKITDAFKEACDASVTLHDKYAYYCSLALDLENLMGIDAFVLMGKLAMETGFRDVSGATHGARGIWQLQPAYTVTNLRRFGQELPFYSELADDSPLKTAIDTLVKDYDDGKANKLLKAHVALIETLEKLDGEPLYYSELKDKSPLKAALDNIVADYSDDKKSAKLEQPITIENFGNLLMQALHDFRYDDAKAGQLVSAYALHYVPEAAADNFIGTWDDNYKQRMDATLRTYAYHNMGDDGAPVQLAMINDDTMRDIRPLDTQQVAGAMTLLRKKQGIKPISATTLIRNANHNSPVYKFKAKEMIGCAPANITYHIDKSMAGFQLNISDIHLTDWQKEFCASNRSVPPITISLRPQMRPEHPIADTNKDNAIASIRPKVRPWKNG